MEIPDTSPPRFPSAAASLHVRVSLPHMEEKGMGGGGGGDLERPPGAGIDEDQLQQRARPRAGGPGPLPRRPHPAHGAAGGGVEGVPKQERGWGWDRGQIPPHGKPLNDVPV